MKTDQKFIEFDKKVLQIVLHIRPYVKHRLYTAESTGIVPRNMYKTDGIIDEAVISLFENYRDKAFSDQEVKLELFKIISNQLDELFASESFHQSTLSTSKILSHELEKLEENFEMDLDNDLLMPDELDDISYKQKNRMHSQVLYLDAEQNIVKALDIKDERGDLSEEKRLVLNKIYNWLPLETSNILDLFVFGKLTYEEIATVKGISTDEVKTTIRTVGKNFRKNLN